MRTRQDVESFLLRSNLSFKELEENMWLIREVSSGENIVISLTGELVLFRCKVIELNAVQKLGELLEKLMAFNAADMVHGAYGISGGAIVLTCSLRLENLDYNEFQGTIDDFSLALTNHYHTLAQYRSAA